MPKIVDHEARRLEITEVAVCLIAEGGLEAATIRKIAQKSGYSKGVVEHYFDNKEELISATLEWANLRYRERVEKSTEGLRGLAAIKKCLEATLPLSEEMRVEWKVRLVSWSIAVVDEALQARQGARFQNAVDHFALHFQEAFDDKEVPQRETAQENGRRLLNITSGIAIAALHNEMYGKRAFLEGEISYLINNIAHAH